MILIVFLALTLGYSGEQIIMDHPVPGAMLSPDGKQFAYTDHNALYVVEFENKRARQLIPSGPLGLHLNWTPDSKAIYFRRPDPAKPMWMDLYRLTLETGDVQKLMSHVSGLDPSPDGKRLLCGGEFGRSLVIAGADGKLERKLPEQLFYSSHAWSPDGTQILFQNLPRTARLESRPYPWEPGPAKFTLYDVATGERKELFTWDKTVDWFTWPPGAGGIYFLADGQLWHYSITGGEKTQVTHDLMGFAAFHGASADGSVIVVERLNPPPDFWDNLLAAMSMRRTLYDPPLKMVLLRLTR